MIPNHDTKAWATRPLRTSFTVPFAIAFCLTSTAWGWSQQRTFISKHEIVAPKWHVELRATIPSEPLGLIVGQGHETRSEPRTSLWFLDNNTIVVTFITREDYPRLSTRGTLDANTALRLRAVFFEAENGNVANSAAWPTETSFASIVAVHDRKFVAQTGAVLTLYSPKFDVLKTLRLPPLQRLGWVAISSPTGKSILLVPAGIPTSIVPWLWVDTDELEIKRSWQEIQSGNVAISDDMIAMSACVWLDNCEPTIEIRGPTNQWRSIAPSDRKRQSHIQFVNNEMLFLLSDPAKLIRSNGHVEFAEDMHSFGGCWPPQAVPSSDGGRFVVPSCKLKGAIREFDIGGHDVLEKLLVYDAPFRGPSYVLDLKGPTMKDLTILAISPDGSRLAILNVEKLTLEQIDLPRAP